MKPKLLMRETKDYESLVPFFIENQLEFSEDEPVPTDLVRCWEVVHGREQHRVGAIVLARRQGEFIIDGIAVEPVYRKMQLGRIMLEKAVSTVRNMGGSRLYLVAHAPEFFRKNGFVTVERNEAPEFFECLTCPQYGMDCHPEVMRLEVTK